MSSSSPTNELEIDHPGEIAAWLEEMVDDQVKLELEGPGGETLALQPLRIQRGRGCLDLRLPGLQAELPEWVLRAPVRAHALLDRIQLDFDLGPQRVLLDEQGLPLLRVELPRRLRRHQRRQAFRVQPLSLHHPRALLPREAELPLRLRTVDLSAGGVALLWSAALQVPAIGAQIGPLELELEREARVRVKLRVQHVEPTENSEIHRIGCAFVDLSPAAERQLSLYLNQAQRRQRSIGR